VRKFIGTTYFNPPTAVDSTGRAEMTTARLLVVMRTTFQRTSYVICLLALPQATYRMA
jgi:hypothetical protein